VLFRSLITDYTKNVYPTKLNEYLALGKPVISTALQEIIEFNKSSGDMIYLAGGSQNLESCVSQALDENSSDLQEKRIETAKKNSWENRIEKMSGLIDQEIKIKKIDMETRWKENLINLYRTARKRLIRLAAICLLLYLVLFKTSFVWFLASPLKISDSLQKADAIVVFGGGVGETGSPGKSTIERARYAVELYKLGYANKIIFSSGYIYIYNDAENMKLFAISMGVPDGDIILEQKGNSAYENARFSKEILDQKGWSSIILISSPYNMRRVEMIFNKLGKGIKVSYLPVKKCQFYDRQVGRRLEQINAIIHEYLGILYYWLKGYI
jgi:uncharacterized SAM-binding protein YcdF (DUF218 family)